jgi:hypothetical protein
MTTDTPKGRGRPKKEKLPKAPAKMGRPSAWSVELGKTICKGITAPLPIFKLLMENPVKKLLSRMALDEKFKAKTLAPFQEDEKTNS